jgi:hypothetical protein
MPLESNQTANPKPASNEIPTNGSALHSLALHHESWAEFDAGDLQSPAAIARNRLSEQALIANPTELRQIFAANIGSLDSTATGYLNETQIAQGLSDQAVTGKERQMLNILYRGYDMFARAGNGITDANKGINLTDLQIVEKSMNPNLPGDPFEDHMYHLGLTGATFPAAVVGALLGVEAGPPGMAVGAALGAAVGAVGGLAIDALGPLVISPQVYSDVARQYREFTRNF